MSILTTVAACGARPSGVISMSSNEYRMSSRCHRWMPVSFGLQALILESVKFMVRHAAVNARRQDVLPLPCWAGGGRRERGKPAAGADRGGAAAREPRGGPRAVVHRGRGVLPGRGQGPGEVRDAARPPGRRKAGHRRRRGARLFARGVLPGASVVLAGGHVGAARRAPRPPRAGETAPGDRGVHPRRRCGLGHAGRAGRGPVRGAAAPADHRAGPGPVSTRSFWPPAEAAQADYETLRAHLLRHGVLPDDLAAARFARRGLAGLITSPVSEPVFAGELSGAARAAWNPRADERITALAAGFQFLLEAAATLQCRPATMGGQR